MTIELIGGGGAALPMPTYTWAGKPASYALGQPVFISDAGVRGSHWYHDGTNWKPIGGNTVLATLGATSAAIGNTETVVFQYRLPANLWQAGGVLRLNGSVTKSGTTNTAVISGHLGPLGTVADPAIFGVGGHPLSTANRQISFVCDVRLEDPLTTQQMPNTSGIGYSLDTGALTPPTTLAASIATTPSYYSVTIYSGSTDTVQLMQAQLYLVGKAN